MICRPLLAYSFFKSILESASGPIGGSNFPGSGCIFVQSSGILNPQIVGPMAVTKIERTKCYIPQWNGSINYALDESIEIFVLEWMKVVDVTRDSGGTEDVLDVSISLEAGFVTIHIWDARQRYQSYNLKEATGISTVGIEFCISENCFRVLGYIL